MSKRLLRKKVFELSDFQRANRIERLYIYLMEPDSFALNDVDFKYLNLLKKAFHIMSNEVSNVSAATLIYETLDIETESRVWKIMDDVRQLFGNMIKRNKEFDRMVLQEKIANIAKKANEDKKMELELECYRTMMKLSGADVHSADNIDPTEIQLPDLIFTSDPAALYNPDIEDAEIIDEDE